MAAPGEGTAVTAAKVEEEERTRVEVVRLATVRKEEEKQVVERKRVEAEVPEQL